MIVPPMVNGQPDVAMQPFHGRFEMHPQPSNGSAVVHGHSLLACATAPTFASAGLIDLRVAATLCRSSTTRMQTMNLRSSIVVANLACLLSVGAPAMAASTTAPEAASLHAC